jgi:imidazolonepropionase-like amidohydrolase
MDHKIITKLSAWILLPCFIIAALAGCKDSKDPVSAPQEVGDHFALRNGVLIDGTGAAPLPDAVIIVRDGRIDTVGTEQGVEIPDEADIINVRGTYILPGFMNTHVHSGYNEDNLREWAQAGVTTVRDLGDFAHSPVESYMIRDELITDNRNARLVAAGPLVTTVGGYGNYAVVSPEEAEYKINTLIDAGADLIKIAIEDDLQGRRWPMLSQAEIDTIVHTAHSRGKPVSAHITRIHHIDMALLGEVDDLAHMAVETLPDSIIARLVAEDIYWVPTLELWDGVRRVDGSNWDDIAKANLGRFVQAGGKAALGTDFDGYIFEFQLGMPMLEMELMQEAGMTPMEIIVAATKHSAHVCNLGAELGTIESGKVADIIIVGTNPLDDLQALQDIRMVIHNGEVIRP